MSMMDESSIPDEQINDALRHGFGERVADEVIAATPSNAGSPNVGEGVIPAGMVPWHGGDSEPADWDGGPTLCRDGSMFPTMRDIPSEWAHDKHSETDIIAYTPRAASPTVPACADDPWRSAVIEALVANCIHEARHDNDPVVALADLIIWERKLAVDPRLPAIPVDREALPEGFGDLRELVDGLVAGLAASPAYTPRPVEWERGQAIAIAQKLMVAHFGPGKSSAVPASWVIDAMIEFAALARPVEADYDMRLAFVTGFGQALHNTSLTADQFYEEWMHAGCPVLARPVEAGAGKLEEENARLREALEPFARYADSLLKRRDGAQDEPAPVDRLVFGIDGMHVTIGDLRRARAVLTAPAGGIAEGGHHG